MSITAVRTQITKALEDRHLTDAEVVSILKATKPALSNGEAKAIGDLYDRVTTQPKAPPGAVICFPMMVDQPAMNRLNTFIAAKNLPFGANKDALKQSINDVLATVRLDPKGVEKPRGLSKLVAVELSDPRMLGGPMRRAYVDVATKQFYISEDRPILNNATKFWGPFALPKAEPKPASPVTDARLAEIRKAFNGAHNLNYKMGSVAMSHLGASFKRVEIMSEKHPDGYTYTAYLNVGALSPTAPQMDANLVPEFLVERSGGLAGLTEWAGPIKI